MIIKAESYFYCNMIDSLIIFMNSANIGPMNLGNPKELFILQIANLIIMLSIKK